MSLEDDLKKKLLCSTVCRRAVVAYWDIGDSSPLNFGRNIDPIPISGASNYDLVFQSRNFLVYISDFIIVVVS